MGGRNCCVVGCGNHYKAHGKSVKFYQFPTRDQEQRKQWISAVKRVGLDGKSWQPSKFSTICSVHFKSGMYSRTRGHPDYVPSIFPTLHVKQKSEQDESRFKRQLNRAFSKATAPCSRSPKSQEEILEELWQKSDQFSTQTEEEELPSTSSSFTWEYDCFFLSKRSSHASTMARLPKKTSQMTATDHPLLDDSSTQTTLEAVCDKSGFNIDKFTERQFKAFTGVARTIFSCILWMLDSVLDCSKTASRKDKLAMFLIKLKLNISFGALSALFSMSEGRASQIFQETLQAMVRIAGNGVIWLSRNQIQARMPASFRGLYPSCRVIIDCSEIAIERPKKLEQRVLTWSNYKGRHTVKFLVGCAPSGEITFFSRTRGGRSTDAEITIDSGILNYIEVGDLVLADKGFPQIQSDLNNAGGILVMPPFKTGQHQFSSEESNRGYQCASVRVHVERCIARMKTFEVLKFLNQSQIKDIDDILYVISFLVNFNKDLIKGK